MNDINNSVESFKDELTQARINLREQEALSFFTKSLIKLNNDIDPATGEDLRGDYGLGDIENNVVPFRRRSTD